ncbi:hypothetical protein PGS_00013450 [Porphyromonas gingivalis A7A1-28]|nr:hypothetical protein PGS_00013450 [Porphyromonas gingivalis A7A1-28]
MTITILFPKRNWANKWSFIEHFENISIIIFITSMVWNLYCPHSIIKGLYKIINYFFCQFNITTVYTPSFFRETKKIRIYNIFIFDINWIYPTKKNRIFPFIRTRIKHH